MSNREKTRFMPAGLTVVMYGIIQQHGLELLGTVVLIGGLIQLASGLAGLGQWFRAVSPAVIRGMLAGIGVLILASQFHVMLDREPKGSGLTNLVTIPAAVYDSLVVPKLGERSQREFKAEKLRQLGELHRRQEAIRQRVIEVLPDRSDFEAWENRSPEEEQEDIQQVQVLADVQAELLEDFRRSVEDLKVRVEQVQNNGTDGNVGGLADAAVQNVETALAAMRDGEGRDALKTQDQAVESIAVVMQALKSHNLAGLVGMLTIVLIVLWQTFCPKKLKLIPAPLIAIIITTAVAVALSLPVVYIEVPNNIFGELMFPSWERLQGADWRALLASGFVVAAIASVETLLCATAVDQMQDRARTNYDKELFSQGVGNSICGLLGALPMTGVIVRSSTNVLAGAQTRLSAILHGVWLLIFVSSLAFVLRLIPTAALAALLVYVGYRLVDRKAMRNLLDYGWSEFAIYAATVVMIVVTDLLTGVITGVILAAIKLLYMFSHLRTQLEVDPESRQATLSLEGAAVFVRLPKLASALEKVPGNVELHVDLQHLDYVDHACLDLLTNWAKQHESTGGRLVIDWDWLHARFRRDRIQPARPTASVATPADHTVDSN